MLAKGDEVPWYRDIFILLITHTYIYIHIYWHICLLPLIVLHRTKRHPWYNTTYSYIHVWYINPWDHMNIMSVNVSAITHMINANIFNSTAISNPWCLLRACATFQHKICLKMFQITQNKFYFWFCITLISPTRMAIFLLTIVVWKTRRRFKWPLCLSFWLGTKAW